MQQENLVGSTLGQYQILDELGRGGMAVVYKAWQPSLRRYVALKVLLPYLGGDPEFIQRFQQEAIVAANLNHPNIVTIYEVGQQEGRIFIAMEYVEGQSLEQLIMAEGGLPLERAIPILRQVAAALDYAHKRRFLHRDIKPANILLSEDERVVITDFGIAKALEGSGATARLTSTGTVLGTPAYMSPEQIQGLPVDYRSDLYALGIVAYEMLSGQVPFDGTTTALLYAQVNNPPPAITRFAPGLPPHVEWVIMRMLAKQPSERFVSAGEFVEALASGSSGVSPTPGVAQPSRFPTPPPQNSTAVMPPGMQWPQATPGLPSQPYGMPTGTPPGGIPQVSVPSGGYGYPATQAAPGMPSAFPQPYGAPGSPPGYGYPPGGYAPSATSWAEPAPVKKKRAVWPWVLGGGLMLVVVAAVVVLGYLLLGRATPAKLLEKGNDALTAQDYAAAQEAFEQALDKEPENAAAYRGLGWTYYEQGQYKEAEAAFEAALQLAPDDVETHEGKARSAYAAGRYEAAIDSLKFWAEHTTSSGEPYRLLGLALYQLQRYSEAAEALSRAVMFEKNPELYQTLGNSYRALKEWESALAAYQEWATLTPEDAAAHRTVGEIQNILQRYDEAVASFSRSLELEKDARAYEGLGDAYLAQNAYEPALAQYREAVSLDPNSATAHRNMGWCLFRLERYPEAITAFEHSIAIQASPSAYQGLGNSHAALGNHELALEAYQHWLVLTPESAWSHKAVGVSLTKLGRYEEAVDVYSRCVQLGDVPGVVDCYSGLGDANLALKNYAQALSAYLEWLQRSPNSIGANSKVGAAYIGLGDCDSAKPYLEKALSIDPNYQYAKNLLRQCP